MTPRENVIWFDLHEDEQSLKNKVAEHPHSKFWYVTKISITSSATSIPKTC